FDNTRAAANKKASGGTKRRNRWRHKEGEPLGYLPALDIDVHFVKPNHGQSKPIERAWRDMKEGIERDPRCADAYSGDDPREREGRKPRPMPLALFEQVVSDAFAVHNTTPGRRSEICGGTLSFAEAFERDFANSVLPKS